MAYDDDDDENRRVSDPGDNEYLTGSKKLPMAYLKYHGEYTEGIQR
jgi:hypothetical protein